MSEYIKVSSGHSALSGILAAGVRAKAVGSPTVSPAVCQDHGRVAKKSNKHYSFYVVD